MSSTSQCIHLRTLLFSEVPQTLRPSDNEDNFLRLLDGHRRSSGYRQRSSNIPMAYGLRNVFQPA